jgi:hypothetical protein
MTWTVTREGKVIYVDLSSLEAAEWEALLDTVDAELVPPPSQVVLRAGKRQRAGSHEALVESLAGTIRAQGVKVRLAFD